MPWELNVATYREIEVLRRPFVVPGTRVVTQPVRIVAHKNHVDLTGSPDDAARALMAIAGTPQTSAPALPADAHAIIMKMTPVAGPAFSTRRLEDALWSAVIPGEHPYSYFPAVLRGHWLSVGADHVVVGLDEDARSTSTMLARDGSLDVVETNFSGAQHPVVQGALLVRKIARFVKLANDVTARLGAGNIMALSVVVAGTDWTFSLSYDPRDLTRLDPGALRSQFDLPSGRPLAASIEKAAVVDGVLNEARVAFLANELQADLFHPLRVRPHPALGGGEFSICYSEEAVTRYARESMHDIWAP